MIRMLFSVFYTILLSSIMFSKSIAVRIGGMQSMTARSRLRSTITMVDLQSPTKTTMTTENTKPAERRSFMDSMGAAGIASAAVVAASAVNAAVGMRPLSAPDAEKTFVYKDGAAKNRTGIVDDVGLPLVYDKTLIEAYWKNQGSALTQRWAEFLGYAVPYLTKVITMAVSGGSAEIKQNSGVLARDARIIIEKLGPTYIKMGQMMSVRPDVLPKAALEELQILQDSVKPFDTSIAIAQIESELKGPLGEFFSEISSEPVAAASLAQVYKAKLVSTGEFVALKIQRPDVLQTVSKDLYVLRRAAEVTQGLIERFLPQQRTNYVALLNEWAVGFYTELDFLNEAANQQRLKELLITEGVDGVYVPQVFHEYTTRRLLVSEWMDGVKLSSCQPNVIKEMIPAAQEAFLTQLLQVGFFHADPHPGNIMYLDKARGSAKLALIDFGLVASVKQSDMDTMISCIIHLANKDYTSLVDDFIKLGILPQDCDRPKVIPLMDKALTPYVKGGGAQTYEAELRKTYGLDGTLKGNAGGFQAMTQDALTVMNDIPFSIPPYFALLGRAIVTLEGIALTGDPSYGIIMEAYPFVARKLLSEDRPEIQKALQELLYSSSDGFKAMRLSSLVNSALGNVAKSSNSFIDLDSLPEDAISLDKAIKFMLSEKASSLRLLLVEELITAGDILLRQSLRKTFSSVTNTRLLPRLPISLPFFNNLLPKPELIPLPFLIPKVAANNDATAMRTTLVNAFSTSSSISAAAGQVGGLLSQGFIPVTVTPTAFLEASAPKLSREEEIYALSLNDAIRQVLGADVGSLVSGDALKDPLAAARFVVSVLTSQKITGVTASDSPLLMNALTQLSSTLKSDKANSHGDLNSNVVEMLDAFNSLTAEETRSLQESTAAISDRLVDKLILRLQVLV